MLPTANTEIKANVMTNRMKQNTTFSILISHLFNCTPQNGQYLIKSLSGILKMCLDGVSMNSFFKSSSLFILLQNRVLSFVILHLFFVSIIFAFSVDVIHFHLLKFFKIASSSIAISSFGAISENVKSENKSSFSISSTVFPSCSIAIILS